MPFRRGEVGVTVRGHDGFTYTLATLREGECFGESGILAWSKYPCEVVTFTADRSLCTL